MIELQTFIEKEDLYFAPTSAEPLMLIFFT